MTINYKYSSDGIKAFIGSALNEAMENYPPLVLSVGEHQIKIPMFPETFESMEAMLWEGFNILREEYPEEVTE